MNEFEEANASFKSLKNYRRELHTQLKERIDQFNHHKNYMTTRVKMMFSQFMQINGSQGVVEIDHEEKTLALKVRTNDRIARAQGQPAQGKQGKQGKQGTGGNGGQAWADTETLSGGERSFSSTCFIMALWETMECPFRCMDEFDVFMDMVNRTLSMQGLISVARAQKSRQFIFITPQDMKTIERASDIKIHTLFPPEREGSGLRQTRLTG